MTLEPGNYRLELDPETRTATIRQPMVRRMFTWNANRSEGPLYATRDEAVEAEPFWRRDGLELVAVYVASDDRIVHTEKIGEEA